MNKKLLISLFLVYGVVVTWFYAYEVSKNIKNTSLAHESEQSETKQKTISKNYFTDSFSLKDYSSTKFKLTPEAKTIVSNIRQLHKSASLIWEESADKEVCAGYIWTLSEELWWKTVPYHIGMLNANTKYPAKAWELPAFYKGMWWEILIDLWDKFSISEKDFWEKVGMDDLRLFFKTAFLEDALFGDIGFLYRDTRYASFLNGWSSNSHIVKNMWISNFEFIVWEDNPEKTELDIISDTLNCSSDINKGLFSLLEHYKIYLNWKRVAFSDDKFYYLSEDNILWDEVKLKYLDKISYEDITLTHYIDSRSQVNGLFDMVCSGKYFPINVISINKRLIEKM